MAINCPECGTTVSEDWRELGFEKPEGEGGGYEDRVISYGKTPVGELPWELRVDGKWMMCPECTEILVRVRRALRKPDRTAQDARPRIVVESKTWLAVPRTRTRQVDALVPEGMKRDYSEAAEILDSSPRMSSVLSRRILSDLLAEFAGRNEFTLAEQIDNFIADVHQPATLKDNLHYLREIGNFSAHTKKDRETGVIIEVTAEEAEWTLDVVDRVFDYFIVSPSRDAARRAAVDEKLKKAGRKPISDSRKENS